VGAFSAPHAITIQRFNNGFNSSAGDLLVVNAGSSTVYSVNTTTGSTRAFIGYPPYWPGPYRADGPGALALFNTPCGIANDPLSATIYVADTNTHLIRLVDASTPAYWTSVLAGSGAATLADGTGFRASFNWPHGLVVTPFQEIIVADTNNHAIRVVTPAGVVTTRAGRNTAGYADGVCVRRHNAQLTPPPSHRAPASNFLARNAPATPLTLQGHKRTL